MAYFVKNLNKRKKGGEIIQLKLNIKNCDLFIVKKDSASCFSFLESKIRFVDFKSDGFSYELIIPSSGFWQVGVRSRENVKFLKFEEEIFYNENIGKRF